jgi:hypothetical protein
VDQGRADRGLSDRGVSSVQFLLASALALILFLALANLVVVQYGRGAMRSALEQAARAGALTASSAECESRAIAVVDELLGGRMSDGLVVGCRVEPGRVSVEASATFQSWTFLTPDFQVSMTSEAIVEPER